MKTHLKVTRRATHTLCGRPIHRSGKRDPRAIPAHLVQEPRGVSALRHPICNVCWGALKR